MVAAAALVGMILILARDRGGSARLPFAAVTPAAAPFEEFGEARVGAGYRCLRVLVASNDAQRTRGLRDVRTLAPYDGMLFVNAHDTDARYTMASTPTPLDITWYAAAGTPVDHTTMTPCPGTDATCPEYVSRARYRYALERPAGAGGTGALAACAA